MDGSENVAWHTVSAQGTLARTPVTNLLAEQDSPGTSSPHPRHVQIRSGGTVLPSAPTEDHWTGSISCHRG